MSRALAVTVADLGAALVSIQRQAAAAPASSPDAIAIITASPAARALAERAEVEWDGRRWSAYELGADEFGPFGFGATREAAIADLIENIDLDTSPPLTPEQLAAENAAIRAEDDWIPPGGWDDDDDEQLRWETAAAEET